MPASRKTVTELASERQRLWDEFNSKPVDDPAVDAPLFKMACAVEARLVKSEFRTAADKLIGLEMLAGGDDSDPDYWCVFKQNLLKRMMQFA